MSRRLLAIGSFAIGAMLVASVAVAVDGFTDVGFGDTHAEGIDWAAQRGIVVGRDDGTYGPGESVTRGQIATILQRHDETIRASPRYLLTPICGETTMRVHNLGRLGSGAATVQYSVDGGDRIDLPMIEDDDVLDFDPGTEGIVSLFVDSLAWAHAPTAQDCTPPAVD
jgi:hypothetical protein